MGPLRACGPPRAHADPSQAIAGPHGVGHKGKWHHWGPCESSANQRLCCTEMQPKVKGLEGRGGAGRGAVDGGGGGGDELGHQDFVLQAA